MGFTNDEVVKARKAVEKETGLTLSHELLYSLVRKVEENKTQMSFPEALRFALNTLNIHEEETRSVYKKAVGKLFGSHGGRKAARNRRSGPPPQKRPRPTVVGTIVEEKGGQFSFKV
ncbi:MAG: hypothetical protein OQJ98_02295 [Candidatus Pacebacteria bacterium]|nr:hypothetical protein [Candidatus Paceibacterota bacterium]